MKSLFIILILAGFIWALNSCDTAKTDTASAVNVAPSKDSLIKRGHYLVSIIGCNDCHSPKKMGAQGPFVDTALALSGFPANEPAPVATPEQLKNGLPVFAADLTAAAGPWGTSFSANITSDATGIGNWTLDQFKNALRNGKYLGLKEERMLMPPMPWEDFAHMDDADVEAIFTYLKSTKPVKNVVPAYRPPGK
ncbi:MAG: c-type cytochrome [Sphingobacteriales bacterium]